MGNDELDTSGNLRRCKADTVVGYSESAPRRLRSPPGSPLPSLPAGTHTGGLLLRVRHELRGCRRAASPEFLSQPCVDLLRGNADYFPALDGFSAAREFCCPGGFHFLFTFLLAIHRMQKIVGQVCALRVRQRIELFLDLLDSHDRASPCEAA